MVLSKHETCKKSKLLLITKYECLDCLLLGGYIADKWGGKWIWGISLLASSLLTMMIPAAAYISPTLIVTVRILTGVAQVPVLKSSRIVLYQKCLVVGLRKMNYLNENFFRGKKLPVLRILKIRFL